MRQLTERRCLACFDCGTENPASYMVHRHVWKSAMPDYNKQLSILRERYGPRVKGHFDPNKHIWLCFGCIEKRLGRSLRPEDFNFTLPINHGIALGLKMQCLQLAQAVDNFMTSSVELPEASASAPVGSIWWERRGEWEYPWRITEERLGYPCGEPRQVPHDG